MTSSKQIVGGMRVTGKTSGVQGTVLDIRFTTKVPCHPKSIQVKWDNGLTTWIDVRKVSL